MPGKGQNIEAFVALFSGTWTSELKVDRVDAPGHPLAGEFAALVHLTPASLPYITDKEVRWCTVATSAAALQEHLQDLRAWLFPSLGSEVGFVSPNANAQQGLVRAILARAPHGYFRWKSDVADLGPCLRQLERMRSFLESRPQAKRARVPSLRVVRTQLEVALVAGDRERAEVAVGLLDRHHLDSAVNTLCSRIRVLSHFRDFEAIAGDASLEKLARSPLPRRSRIEILEALYLSRVAPKERDGDLRDAESSFKTGVLPLAEPLLRVPSPEDPIEVLRLFAYRSRAASDSEFDPLLQSRGAGDHVIAALLATSAPKSSGENAALEELIGAVNRGDAKHFQDALSGCLRKGPKALPGFWWPALTAWLESPLGVGRNAELSRLLVEAGLARAPVQSRMELSRWPEVAAAMERGLWEDVERFLLKPTKPSFVDSSRTEIASFLDAVESALTSPNLDEVIETGVQRLLVAAVRDLQESPNFPSSAHANEYSRLLQLWTAASRGSTDREDVSLFLLLADAALQSRAESFSTVAQAIEEWWNERPVRRQCGFLLECLGTVAGFAADHSRLLALWMRGAEFVRRAYDVPPLERRLWRRLGAQLGLASADIDPLVPIPTTAEEREDPLNGVQLGRIAIVSLREKQANAAAKIIRERFGADVKVISDAVAGVSTSVAADADYILLVWAATSHAVYRAFDNVRNKVVYVPGTGAESIVLALERQLIKSEQAAA